MPVIQCPINGCDYQTDDVDPAIAAALLTVHNNVHVNAPAQTRAAPSKAPKIQRPSVSRSSTEETWNSFLARWRLFKRGTALQPNEACQQLFECCDEELGDDILKNSNTDLVGITEDELLVLIKRLAVTPVAVSVRRSDLLSFSQCNDESARTFYARIRGKAATCAYAIECSDAQCNQSVDFTDTIIKDVFISGLSDDEIRREVLGWSDLDRKSIEETVAFVEAKEMAREALNRGSTTASISTYRKHNKQVPQRSPPNRKTGRCKECKVEIEFSVWSRRQKQMVERHFCSKCWANNKKPSQKEVNAIDDETGAISIIGGITQQSPPIDHLIFSENSWKKMQSMKHRTLQLTASITPDDYYSLGRDPPTIKPTNVEVATDTGAQSCLWDLQNFLKCGFKETDLIPVRHKLLAANKEKIPVVGAILLRLSGNSFSWNYDALIQLKVIPKDFPCVGAATTVENASIETHQCDCPKRTTTPPRPDELPFECCPENNQKMKDWLIERYSTSTFNKCTHQTLPGMTGPAMSLHVNPDATPHSIHTPLPVPIHWQDTVKKQLDDDVNLGVLEKVPFGEPSLWCHRMVLTRKPEGSPRRTVDLSPLNPHCLRETHHVKSPFHQAKSVPPNTWKTVIDAWNGFHSVPITPEGRHYTTFITPWGRYRYKVAPQGFLASGDGYSRRYDEIIADVERKTKVVDDTLMWDSENALADHWWRVIDFLDLIGHNGIIANIEKFQFANKTADFAGFTISEKRVKPLQKFINAIDDFPTPSKITDVRSWFGLVNQVSHYDKLSELMSPFKHLLSPRSKFEWTDELDKAFRESKKLIVEAIKHGVEIYDMSLPTSSSSSSFDLGPNGPRSETNNNPPSTALDQPLQCPVPQSLALFLVSKYQEKCAFSSA
ncbi:uncharacterized protein [Clytia hemisphaerica]|uniref:uncharacterized protein n=1 Tax=Clytia hemisphaerica TaxID=252671 RepID=UPI0034D780EA